MSAAALGIAAVLAFGLNLWAAYREGRRTEQTRCWWLLTDAIDATEDHAVWEALRVVRDEVNTL